MTRQLNLKGINVAINIYIDKDDPFIQKILNNLLNDRHNYKIRMITPNDDLVTYFEDGGILCEEMHDFHTVNLKSFKTLHQKSL